MNQIPDRGQPAFLVDESWPASPVELMMGSDRARGRAKAASAARLVHSRLSPAERSLLTLPEETYRRGDRPEAAAGDSAREGQLAERERARDLEEAHEEQVRRHLRGLPSARPPASPTPTTTAAPRFLTVTHRMADLLAPETKGSKEAP